MFDDDEDEGDTPVDMFIRNSDYGGGLDEQRTNQDEMDQLMKPCLDFDDDDDEEESGGAALQGLKPKLDNGDAKEPPQQEYNISKYFSNGDVDRGHIGTDNTTALSSQTVFSKRNGKAGMVTRYNNEDDDEDDGDTYGRKNIKALQDNYMDDDDDDDDELERGGDPLSLDDLDGWMNQINGPNKN